MLFLKNFIRLL